MGLDPKQLLVHVVRPALAALGLPGGVLAEKLVMGTAAQESDGFRYVHQLGKGPALSLWQIEPATARDTLTRCRSDLQSRISAMAALIPGEPVYLHPEELMIQQLPGNLYLGAAMCRLVYYMKPFKMPAEPPVDARNWCAQTWKRAYNTIKGAGTVDQFVRHWVDARLDSLWP